MLKFRLDHIGKNEIARSIKVLEENTDIKKIFVRISRNDEVQGAEYDNIEDLLSDEYCVCSFSNKEEYIEYIDEDEENHSDVLELFNNGTVHCDFKNNRVSNNVEDIVKPIIEGGDYCNYYSREEAIENLNGSEIDESLVVFLLHMNIKKMVEEN